MALIFPSRTIAASPYKVRHQHNWKRARSPSDSDDDDSSAEDYRRKVSVRRMRIRRDYRRRPARTASTLSGAVTSDLKCRGLVVHPAAAPINTTQFLMGEHGSANNSPDSDWERFHSETEEFESRQFAKDYSEGGDEAQHLKNELISQYLSMEKGVQTLEKQYEEWRRRIVVGGRGEQGPPADGDLVEEIHRVRAEIEELTRENAELDRENRRLRVENGREEEGEASRSSSDSSDSSSSSSSSSSCCSSCCDSSSESDGEEVMRTFALPVSCFSTVSGDKDIESSRSRGSCNGDSCGHEIDSLNSFSESENSRHLGSCDDKEGSGSKDDTGYESDRSGNTTTTTANDVSSSNLNPF